MTTRQLRDENAVGPEFRTGLHLASLGAGAWGAGVSLLVAWMIVRHNELGPSAATLVVVYGVLIGSAWLVFPTIRYWVTEVVVNDRRIEVRARPFLATRFARLDDVEGVTEHSGGMARQLGYGTVVIQGRGGMGATLRHVRDPGDFCREVAARAKGRSRRTG